jgi:hypothetical protein
MTTATAKKAKKKTATGARDFYLKKARPLVVFGRPRAGTRFITNILNSFPEVTMQGEIPDPVMDAVADFIERVDDYYRARASKKRDAGARQFELWRDKKEALIYSFWAGTSQASRAQPGSNCRYFGYKRPEHEQYFSFYETHFGADRARYVFCVRNFVDNYLSIKSRWPTRKIEDVADRYVDSIHRYNDAVAAAPGRVLLFNLDDHVRYGFEYTRSAVLDPLGLKPSSKHYERLAQQGPTNTTEGDHGRKRRTELTPRERQVIEARPELRELFRALCA